MILLLLLLLLIVIVILAIIIIIIIITMARSKMRTLRVQAASSFHILNQQRPLIDARLRRGRKGGVYYTV